MGDITKQDKPPLNPPTTLEKLQAKALVPPERHDSKYHKIVSSVYFRIILTGVLMLLLFLTAFFIALLSELRTQRTDQFEQGVPAAKVIIPETEEVSTENWETYNDPKNNFSFKYPQGWFLNSENPVEIASLPLDQYSHGVGKPPSGNAWVTVAEVDTVGAEVALEEYEVGPNATIISSSYYKESLNSILKITTGYWKDDPNPQEKRQTFDQILSTFQFLE